MAGKSTAEVYVGGDGIVSVAPFGTAAPTTGVIALNAAFIDFGYVSDDGITETTDRSTDSILAWQKNKVVRETVTESSIEWNFTLIQTSKEVVGAYYNGTVASDGSIVIDPAKSRSTIALVMDVIDGANKIRIYAPEARITEIGDQVYQNGEPVGYEVTITASYNETLQGSAKKFYTALAA